MTGVAASQVAGIGLTALITGRLIVGACGARLYRSFDPAGAAAGLAVGTAALALLGVLLSGLGFPTRDLPPLVAALHLPLLALSLRRRRLRVLRPCGRPAEWVSLLAPITLAIALGLLPVTHAGGFSFGNDTYTYCAFSEWLQRHAFSEAARWDPMSPVTGIPALWQSQGYDLGIAHWLALWQASFRPASALVVYPAVSTFGLALLVSVVWLAARQLLRFGRAAAGAVALAGAAVPHALYWGHHNGFLQQGYALPMVVFGLVLLARTAGVGSWRPSHAALLGLPFAFLVSVYLPLAPLLGFAAFVALVPIAWRARRAARLRRVVPFVALTALFVFVYATRDLLAALSPLHRFATSVAGGHIPWSAADFLQFALGTRVLAPGWVNVETWPWSPLNRALTPIYGALVLAGLWHAARRARTRPLAAATGMILLAAAYFALAVRDPWSGRPGHTWNLFKLAQWGSPFVLLLAALAVRRLPLPSTRWRLVVAGLAFALPVSQLGVHRPWSIRFAEAMREMLPATTLSELPALKQRIQALPPGTLLIVGRPVNVNRWLGTAVSLLAWPRAVVADWSDGASISNHPDLGAELHARLLERWDDPRVVPILAGFQPFQTTGVEELGGGFARLLKQPDPVLVHVVNPAGVVREGAGQPTFAVGKGRTKVVVFSPTARAAELEITLRGYPGRPGTRLVVFLAGGDYSHRSVRLASEGPPVAAVPLGGTTSLRIPLELPRGLSTIVLLVDEGRGELDAEQPVTVLGLRVVVPAVASAAPEGGQGGA